MRDWLIIGLLLLPGCGSDGEGDLAAAGGRQRVLSLAWDANTEADLAGYRIYRGLDCTRFDPVGETATAGYTDKVPYGKHQACYEVTAYDTSGNESAPSNTAQAAW